MSELENLIPDFERGWDALEGDDLDSFMSHDEAREFAEARVA